MKKLLSLMMSLVLLVCTLSIATDAFALSKPDAPYTITVLKVSNSSAKIYWHHVTGATGYKLYRSTSKYSGFKLIKKTKKYTYTDKNLSKKKRYYYKVKAYKTKYGTTVNSKYSKTKSIKLSTSLKRAMNGSYRIMANLSDWQYDYDLGVYTLTGYVYDPITVSKAKGDKLKKGSTFTVKYRQDYKPHIVHTEKYKVTSVYSEGGFRSLEIKVVSAKEYNTKTGKTKKTKAGYPILCRNSKNSDYYLSEMTPATRDYETRRTVTLYIPEYAESYDYMNETMSTFYDFYINSSYDYSEEYEYIVEVEDGMVVSFGESMV